MKPNKSKKIILISIILIILIIVLLGVAYIYFATDLLKSSKQTFYKYTLQAFDEEEGYIPTNLTQYFEKMQNTPFQNNGQISCTISGTGNEDEYKQINDFNISFSGLIDLENLDFDEDINLNYSPEVTFPFTVRKKGNMVGIQSEYIGSNFIAESIAQVTQSTGMSTNTNQNNTQGNSSLSTEQLINIYNKYIEVINQQLPDEKFSKVTQDNQTGYKLTLTTQDINNLLVSILETLKTDQETLDLINQYMASEITSDDIDDMIQDINSSADTNAQEMTFDIILYPTNRQLSKIQIVSTNFTIEINKQPNSTGQKYTITVSINEEGNSGTIVFTAEHTGLDTLQTINENYKLEVQVNSDSESYSSQINGITFEISNANTFSENAYIEDFTNNNSLILDNYEQSQVDALMNSIVERIIEVNRDQMNQLGLSETENPLISFVPIVAGATIYNQAQYTIENSNMSELEISAFNAKFEQYASTNLNGATARGLMTVIENNNSSTDNENEKIQEIHFDGAEYEATDDNILLIKSSIEVESNYRVEFEKDPNSGRIYRVVINKR